MHKQISYYSLHIIFNELIDNRDFAELVSALLNFVNIISSLKTNTRCSKYKAVSVERVRT